MKIRAVKFYQAISICTEDGYRVITHLSKDRNDIKGGFEIEMLEGIGIKVDTPRDSVIITFNNLASIQLYKEAEEVKKVASAKK